MAAWWAKAYEGLEGPLGVGGGAPCCAALRCDAMRCDAMRCEGSTGRAANGRLARSDSTAEPQGELAKHSGRGRGRGRGRAGVRACGRGAVWAEATEGRGGAGAARLSCAGVCGRWVRCEGAAQGITAWRGRRIELWLRTAGGGRRARCRCRWRCRCRCRRWKGAVVCGTVRHQQTDLVASRCLESSVLAVRLGWLRSGYECDMTRGQGSGAVAVAVAVAVGGARSWGRGSGRINGRQRRPGKTETETETQAIRAETQKRAVSSGCVDVDAEALGACA